MDGLIDIGAVITGLLLRFGLPVLATGSAAWILTRLDRRWQAEAELVRVSRNSMGAAFNEVRCWEVCDCETEKRTACHAYQQQETPCWQVFRNEKENLKNECLTCPVFVEAPVLTAA